VSFFCDIESLYRKRWRGFSFQCLVKSMHKCKFICFCSLSWNHEDANIDFCLVFFLSFFLNIFVLYVVEEVLLIFCVEFFLFWFYEKKSHIFFCPQQFNWNFFFYLSLFTFWLSFPLWKKGWCWKEFAFFKVDDGHDWFMIDSEWGIEWGSRHHIFFVTIVVKICIFSYFVVEENRKPILA